MEEIKVEQAFIVEGLPFTTRKEAEIHLAFVKLHRNVMANIAELPGLAPDDELLGAVLNHIIADRVEIRKILNGISGWEDNKVESDPKAYVSLRELIEYNDRNRQKIGDADQHPPILVPMMEPHYQPPGLYPEIVCRDAGSTVDWSSGNRYQEHG